MQALVDGDLIAYRCSASAEEHPQEIAFARADNLMRDLLHKTSSDTYRCFLTGGENFRKKIDPQYKANRDGTPRPKWLEACREFLVVNWNSEVTDGIEADDALGIAQDKETDTTIVCSLDKDLLQIPGLHYSWELATSKYTKPAITRKVNYIDGLRSFYASSLIGDKSDNIFGVDGIGKVRAAKALDELNTELEMFNVCRNLYSNDERYFSNLKLLWIMRHEDDYFSPEGRGVIGLDTSAEA